MYTHLKQLNICNGIKRQMHLIVNGGWGGWGTWDTCSATCGIGLRRRHRACDNPVPSNGGLLCFGETVAYDICADYHCKKYLYVYCLLYKDIHLHACQSVY